MVATNASQTNCLEMEAYSLHAETYFPRGPTKEEDEEFDRVGVR